MASESCWLTTFNWVIRLSTISNSWSINGFMAEHCSSRVSNSSESAVSLVGSASCSRKRRWSILCSSMTTGSACMFSSTLTLTSSLNCTDFLTGSGWLKSFVTKLDGNSPSPRWLDPFHQLVSLIRQKTTRLASSGDYCYYLLTWLRSIGHNTYLSSNTTIISPVLNVSSLSSAASKS